MTNHVYFPVSLPRVKFTFTYITLINLQLWIKYFESASTPFVINPPFLTLINIQTLHLKQLLFLKRVSFPRANIKRQNCLLPTFHR